jgi:hypothetical protein
VEYTLNTTAKTATLVSTGPNAPLSDPLAPASFCCGIARQLPCRRRGSRWGGTEVATETAPDGTRAFLLEFSSGTLVYRWVPIPAGQLNRALLRADMDKQYALSTSVHSETTSPGHYVPKF